MNDAGLLAALGIVSTCVAGLIWVIKRMFNDILPALNGLKNATLQNTEATKSADTYLRERNGRDNEHHAAVLNAINQIPNTLKKIAKDQEIAIIKAVKVERQSVKEQKVEHQTVKHTE